MSFGTAGARPTIWSGARIPRRWIGLPVTAAPKAKSKSAVVRIGMVKMVGSVR